MKGKVQAIGVIVLLLIGCTSTPQVEPPVAIDADHIVGIWTAKGSMQSTMATSYIVIREDGSFGAVCKVVQGFAGRLVTQLVPAAGSWSLDGPVLTLKTEKVGSPAIQVSSESGRITSLTATTFVATESNGASTTYHRKSMVPEETAALFYPWHGKQPPSTASSLPQ